MKSPLILVTISSLDVGGAEQHLLQVLPRINKDNFKIMLYVTSHPGTLAPVLRQKGIPVISPPGAWFLKKLGRPGKPLLYLVSLLRLSAVILRHRPRIIHFFLPGPYLLGGFCALLLRAPCLVMSRRSLNNYQKKHPLLSRFEHFLHPCMTRLLANSKAIQAQLIAEGAPQERVSLLYNGVNIEKYFSAIHRGPERLKRGLEPSSLVMIIVANLFPYKGHTDLLYALSNIKETLPEAWSLLCIGRDVNRRLELLFLTEKLGLSKQVHWLGEREDVGNLLAISDLGILCSHEEGFSNSLLECMASNLPVVATNVGGNPEAVIDGEVGFLVPPKDPVALGLAIQKLAQSRTLRQTMGAAARARAMQHFSLAHCVEEYTALYNTLLEEKSCVA